MSLNGGGYQWAGNQGAGYQGKTELRRIKREVSATETTETTVKRQEKRGKASQTKKGYQAHKRKPSNVKEYHSV